MKMSEGRVTVGEKKCIGTYGVHIDIRFVSFEENRKCVIVKAYFSQACPKIGEKGEVFTAPYDLKNRRT